MLATFVLGLVLMPAFAAGPQGGGAAKSDALLESLQIEIWPEYDRPAALVILRAELAADVGLPADVSLRIPASSGGPAAVAYATEKKGRLLKLAHEQSAAADFIVLRFTVPTRFFHVEFYDRAARGTSVRSYKYLWPGDLPVSWLDVVVQEPAGASNVSILPELVEKATGSDGLVYRSAQLGPFKRGTPLPIEIQYTKTDPRTSVEMLKLNVPAPAAQADIPPVPQQSSGFSPTLLGAAALLAATTLGVVGFLWWSRRPRSSAGSAGGAGFCSKCGNKVTASDRFCSKCGAALT